jgi:acetyl esterase/lipase
MRSCFLLAYLCFVVAIVEAQKGQPIRLYPDSVPNAKAAPAWYKETGDSNIIRRVTDPELIPFLPQGQQAKLSAVIICPGGGYGALAMRHEGVAVARKFNQAGVAAFVLKYRLPSNAIMQDPSIGPLQDAQRAIQLIRQHAGEWHIDTARIGIMGFSAGGHLASTALTHFVQPVIDNVQHFNLRPAFGLLIYPVITLGAGAHAGSKQALLGTNPGEAQITLYSNDKQVTPQTPPTFLVHAQDDQRVPVTNSLLFYEAMIRAGVPGELHIYQAGGHGFGLENKASQEDWFAACLHWMAINGWVVVKL